MERVILGIDEAKKALFLQMVEGVEFIQGETENDDTLILYFAGGVTVYASAPTVYSDDVTK